MYNSFKPIPREKTVDLQVYSFGKLAEPCLTIRSIDYARNMVSILIPQEGLEPSLFQIMREFVVEGQDMEKNIL